MPIFIEPGANIDGALNLNDEVTALEVDVGSVLAIALSAGVIDLSGDAPTIVNNDELERFIEGRLVRRILGLGDLAIAGAAGIIHLHDGGASDTNNDEIDVDARRLRVQPE